VSAYALIYPMAAMVLLSGIVLVLMFRARVAAVRSGLIEIEYFRLHQGAREPEQSFKYARHFINLFEAPTLFYVGCLAAMVADVVTAVTVALAWLYVAIRLVHAVIHLGSNRLRYRRNAYALGWLTLLVLWGHIVVAVAARG
jgi:hypothetical protein